jgi:hypothetical protein
VRTDKRQKASEAHLGKRAGRSLPCDRRLTSRGDTLISKIVIQPGEMTASSSMRLLSDKGPLRTYTRAIRYALGITILLVLFYLRGYKSISSNITSLRQCRSMMMAEKQHSLAQQSQAAQLPAGNSATSPKQLAPVRAIFNPDSNRSNSNLNMPDNLLWTERNLTDGSIRYDSRGSSNETSLLVLTMNYNEAFWGTTYDFSRQRTEEDFLDLVAVQVNLLQTALGVMTASRLVYERLKNATSSRDIGRTTIIYRKSTSEYAIGDRHRDEIQFKRRSNLAIIRNNLMARALQDEKHIFWLDSDVIDMTPNLIKTMIERAESNKEEIGLVTARSDLIGIPNYDKNSWGLDRNVKGMLLAVPEHEREHINHRLMDTRRYIPDLTRGLKGDQLGRLDSVGGTSLYIRADLVRNGVNFPPFKIVGTTWGDGGWTGQETEGICYMAKQTSGVNCWSLGDSHYTTHSTNT